MLTIMVLATITSFSQVINDEDFSGSTMVLDSTITNDMKLLIANDRLYAKGGLIETLVNQVSKEKAETGEIQKAAATQNFIDKLNQAYKNYAVKFIKVDTVYIDSLKLVNQIVKIQKWQQKVLNDTDIKEATSLSIWEQKAKRLEKLLYYHKQITK